MCVCVCASQSQVAIIKLPFNMTGYLQRGIGRAVSDAVKDLQTTTTATATENLQRPPMAARLVFK